MARFRQLQTWVTCVLVGFWIGMFTGTHLPKIPKALDTSLPDKTLHYAAFAGLGFLLASRRATIGRIRLRDAALLLGIMAAYGIFDELTQPFFGRTADPYDWFADLIGGTSGLLLFVGAEFVWRRLIQSAPQSVSSKTA